MASIVYVSSSTTDVITEIASTSEVIISNLQGPQGATGPQGPQGTPGGIASVVAPITNAGTETAAIIGINSSSANTANYVVQRDANKEFVAGAVTIDTTLTPTSAPGKLYWDGGGTVNLGLAGGNVSVALGENLVSYVTNAEATTLAVGEVVYVFGASGDRPSVKRASNTSEVTSSKTLGIVAESIAAGQIGFVITRGIINGLTLGSYTAGAPVYLGSTAGTFTSTKPVAPANLVALGWVIRANNGNGQIYVNVQNGFELEELHNVLITSAANGNFLVYDSADGLWKNEAISATAPITYNAGTNTIAANSATTSASGVVQLSDSTSTTSSVLASTPTATKAAFDLATTANATANAAIPLTQKAAANGVATLGADGLVPTNQLPALAITNTFVVNSQAAMLALTAQPGDVAIRTDLSESYILTADPASTLANWQELLTPPDAVTSVDGRVGAVSLSDLYAAKTHASTHASGGSDAVTLAQSQITNLTSDLAAKAPLASPTFTGTVTIPAGSSITGVAYLASANTFTQPQTANSFIPTSSTVPANGINLPAAGTLGLVSNSAVRMQIDGNGGVGIGISPASTIGLYFAKNITGGTDSRGIQISSAVQSDVTGSARIFFSAPSTQATAFTIGTLSHFQAAGATVGAGSTIGVQNGFLASAALMASGVTNAYAFRGLIASATGAWNAYMDGTAANYFAGQTSVGTTSLTMGSGSAAHRFGIFTNDVATVGLVVRGTTSQTANIQEWQSVSGAALGIVSPSGQFAINTSSTTMGAGSVAQQLGIFTNATTTVGLVVRGQASQTGDLTQWQNNTGSNVAWVNSAGDFYGRLFYIGQSSDFGAMANISTFTTGRVGTTIRSVANQTADLAQFQNSNGNTLSSINPAGTFVGNVQDSQLIQYGAEGSVLQNIPTRVHPAETLLKQAVWWIDSAHSGSSGQAIRNLGWGGSALDATAGSTTAADTNDPQYLAWDGINYVYVPGITGNFLSVPDASNLDIVGDIDVRIQIAADDWTPAAVNYLLSKYQTSGQFSWRFGLLSTGRLTFVWVTDGTVGTVQFRDSTVSPTVTDGTPLWVRATLDVDNGASGNDVKFFTSNDGITWTQLGTTVTAAGITSIYAGTSQVEIGSQSNGSTPLAGKIYRAQILNGIDGVPVLDVDTSQVTTGAATSFTALTGQTVTINRATSGRKTTCVTHPVWLFGTDDFMEVNNRWLERTTANYLYLPGVTSNYASAPDSAALDITGDIDLRAKVALDDWTPAATANLISKNQAGAPTYYLNVQTTGAFRLMISLNGTTETIATSTVVNTIADGTTKWVRATRVASTGVVQFFTSDDGSTWTQLGADVSTTSGNIATTTAFLEMGTTGFGGGAGFRGKFFRAQVLNGIGGTVAFDANFETGITSNLPTTFTESSANAATVTINYSGTGYRSAGVIASTYVFPGNPNTFKLSQTSLLDFGATDSFTLVAIARQFATPNSYGVFFEKTQLPPYNGYSFTQQATSFRPEITIRDGVNTATNSSATPNSVAGAVTAYSMVVDRSAQTLYFNVNGTSSATTSTSAIGNISSYYPLAIGRRTYTPGLYNDMEFVAGAVFRRALTAAEFATLTSYFQGRVA